MPPVDLRRHEPPAPPDRAVQRVLAAPVIAAAVVALCGLATSRPFLLRGAPLSVLLLFAAIVTGASFAAGLFAGRRSGVLDAAIALSATTAAGFLVRRIVILRAERAGSEPLEPLAAAAGLVGAAVCGWAFAAAGSRMRSALSRRAR